MLSSELKALPAGLYDIKFAGGRYMSREVLSRVEITLNKEWRDKSGEYIYYPMGFSLGMSSTKANPLPCYVGLIGCILSCCSEEGLKYLLDNTDFLTTEAGDDCYMAEKGYYPIGVMAFTDPNTEEIINLPHFYERLSVFFSSLNSEAPCVIFDISSKKNIYIRLTSAEDFYDHLGSLVKLLGIEIRFISVGPEKGRLIRNEQFFRPGEMVLQYEKYLKLEKMRWHSSNYGIPIRLSVTTDSVFRMLNHSSYFGPRLVPDKKITDIGDAYRYSMRALLGLCTEEGLNKLIGCCDFINIEDDGNSFCIKPTDRELSREVIIAPPEDFRGTEDFVEHDYEQYMRIESSGPIFVREFDNRYEERLNKLAELLNLTIKWTAYDNRHHFIKVFYPADPKPVFDERMLNGRLFISTVRYDN